MNRFAQAALIAAATLTTAGAPTAGAQTLTVYSSLPLHGASGPTTLAVVRGARLALSESGGTAGGRPVRYVSLDDSTRRAGNWTPERASANARRAAHDGATIGYIGEFNSGATAISLPVLEEAGIPQISPTSTYIGLTAGGPGAHAGEPEKYYPHNQRTFFRLTPNDTVQASALAEAMKERGCARVASLTDGDFYGTTLGTLVRQAAAARGLQVVVARRISRHAQSFRSLARTLRTAKVQCVVYTGVTANNAIRLFHDVGLGLPHAKFFASDGVAENTFARHIPHSVARRTLLSVMPMAADAYPAAGQRLFARFHDPNALYGYEAMRLLIDAVNATGPDRTAIVNWLHSVQNRAGVIGTYGFDANGDTTLRTYGLYTIRSGRLTWSGTVTG
jgi:branched-chain amino acid transport system substrate-binding protein